MLKDQPVYDVYCLQYAPYSFSPKGIIGKPLIDFGKTLQDKKVHINFHPLDAHLPALRRQREHVRIAEAAGVDRLRALDESRRP